METLLTLIRKTDTFVRWEGLYRMDVTLDENEITIKVTPFPPDTYDSVRADILEREMPQLETELAAQGIRIGIEYEACALLADVFCFYLFPR